MLALIAMGTAWFTVSRLQAMTGDYTIANRNHNAAVLARAKQALIGHVAMQAAKQGETDPGRLPCPEAAGSAGSGLEGATASTCTFPAVGRLPWRTVGIEKLLDAAGEPLWYVVASGWALGANLVINSNCTSDATMACATGLLTVDGVKDTVALIIAPGPAMSVAASTGCTARNQSRSAPAPTMDARDYVECYSTATSAFVTAAASTSFNDQVLKITAAELLPAIEAAIADRIQHERAPLIKSAYSGGAWSSTSVLPFAAVFADPTFVPTALAPASNFRGVAGTFQGLPPLTYAFTASPGSASACSPTPCTPTPCTTGSDAFCDPGFVAWTGGTLAGTAGGTLNAGTSTCTSAGTPTTLTCTIYSWDLFNSNASVTLTLSATASNVGMALRQINATVPIGGLDTTFNPPYGYTMTAGASTINANGSATLVLSARVAAGTGIPLGVSAVCGLLSQLLGLTCYRRTISVPMALLSDHALVDPSNTTHNWFARNRWPQLSYYAVAQGLSPSPPSGTRCCGTACVPANANPCLMVGYHPDSGKQWGLWLLGGAKIGTQARPPTLIGDLLEGANADLDTTFTLQGGAALLPNKTFNDRIAVVGSN
ncbi:MAG TPA: hypothetical protein VM183_11485 [Burkholderiales bacterium]|nr:hypothetical protein [Burkholderiales bacterium]